MDIKDRNTQIIIGAVILVVLIGAIWWFVASGKNPVAPSRSSSEATSTMPTTTSGEALPGAPTTEVSGESVTVVNQAASDTVQVASATLSQLSWIAVRDDTGRTLGAGLFPAGEQSNVEVPLLRATEPGQHYQVLIYVDNGDHQFDLHTDTLVINPDGSVAGTTFSTTASTSSGQ